MIFTERLPKDPIHAVPLETGLADSTNLLTYELRWQTNATFLRTLRHSADFTNYSMSGHCFTLWNDQFYFLDNPRSAVLYVLEEARAAQGDYSGAYLSTMIRRGKATQILNLGVNHIRPGAIRWDGDSFSVTGIADLVSGNGPFANLGEQVYDDYWMYYLTRDMAQTLGAQRPYTNLKSYAEYKQRGIDALKAHKQEIEKLSDDDPDADPEGEA
jgi:hypothetical protein